MRLKIFSVLDTKADAFQTPFFMPSTGMAVRAFKDLANDGQSLVSRHPGDFQLTCVGEFDDVTARLTSYDQVEKLGYAADYQEIKASDVPVGVRSLKGVS